MKCFAERSRVRTFDLRASGLDVRFRVCDGTDEMAVRDLVAYTVKEFGALNIAVNNIGTHAKGEPPNIKMEEMGLEVWMASINRNLTSCFLGMKQQLIHMIDAGGGVIANTSSLAGVRALETTPSYSAAKAGVIHLSRVAAVQYAKHNIRCNSIAPGMTTTPAFLADFPDSTQHDAFAATKQPIGRMIEPGEVAAAFLWICSDEASMVTGQCLAVDGGWAAA